MRLSIRESALDALVAHAQREQPRECCGILLGHAGGIVEEAVAGGNLAESDARFLLDPKDHIEARRRGRAAGLDVVGFYHSHPHTGASPSPRDVAEAAYPGLLHLIVGLGSASPEVRAFNLEPDGTFHEITLVPTTSIVPILKGERRGARD